MTITAKFSSQCPLCHNQIAVGDKVEWERGSKAAHVSCSASAAPSQSDCEHPQFHRTGCVCNKQFARGTDKDDRSYDAWIAFRDAEWANSDTQVARAAAFQTSRPERRTTGAEFAKRIQTKDYTRSEPEQLADDSEEIEYIERQQPASYRVSRWSRPSDDELEHAAYS